MGKENSGFAVWCKVGRSRLNVPLYPHLFDSLWGKLALTTYKETMDCASIDPHLGLIVTAERVRGGENSRIDVEHMFALNANQLHSVNSNTSACSLSLALVMVSN